MFAIIEITLNYFVLAGIVGASLLSGFILKSYISVSMKKQVNKLENEMLESHAEILRLQKELSDKDKNQSQAPVFSIRDMGTETSKESLPDTNVRKKMLLGNTGKSNS